MKNNLCILNYLKAYSISNVTMLNGGSFIVILLSLSFLNSLYSFVAILSGLLKEL